MSRAEACLRAIAHAEERLTEPVSVADLADAAGYSIFHFCRVFARCVRMSPYTYVVRRRLTGAAADVVGGDRRIVDIATGCGFESHEGFARAFARVFGCLPGEARAAGYVPTVGRLPRLSGEHLACLERHGGLPGVGVAGEGPSPGPLADALAVAVPLTWPGEPTRPAPDVHARWVAFALAPGADDVALAVDWLVHGWAFAERARLALPEVRVAPADGRGAGSRGCRRVTAGHGPGRTRGRTVRPGPGVPGRAGRDFVCSCQPSPTCPSSPRRAPTPRS